MRFARPFSIFVFLFAITTLSAATPEIAVLNFGDPVMEPLLLAELSKRSEVNLVEREKLREIVQEKTLAAFGRAGKFSTLGGLIGADGLLILEKIGGVPSARLVAVRTGACLFAEVFPEGQKSTEKFVSLVVARTVRAAPKLLVERADALPVSVLNIRAAVFSPANARLETDLSRLLEFRLASVPNVILLERRKLGDASFERSLDATDLPPLRNGAVLIDGGFEGVNAGAVAVKLRLRRPGKGKESAFASSGDRSDPSAIADDLAGKVVGELGVQLSDRVDWDPPSEREAFFQEAVWAWNGNAYQTALEAAESARALGDDSAELSALTAWLLSERASPGSIFYQGKSLQPWAPPEPAEQARLLEQALAEYRNFRDGGSRLGRFEGDTALHFRPTDLQQRLVDYASKLLQANETATPPLDLSRLRRTVHDVAGMTAAGDAMPYSLAMSSKHAKDWAEDRMELMAFYEKLLRSDHKWMVSLLKYFPRSEEEALGSRFRNDPKAGAAWRDFLARMEANEKTRVRALLIRAGQGRTPSEQEAYREFLKEVARDSVILFQKNQLGALLEADRKVRSDQFRPEQSDLLLALLMKLPASEPRLFDLANSLDIPGGKEALIWEAFVKYRERCLAAAPEEKRAKVAETVSSLGTIILRSNPAIVTERPAAGLTVRRFWHPYGQPAHGSRTFVFNQSVASGSSVWIAGFAHDDHAVYEVSLSDLSTKVHRLPCAKTGRKIALSPEALWMMSGEYPANDQPMEMFLARRDRRSGELTTWPLPQGGILDVVRGRIFISFWGHGQGDGLGEFDPATGKMRTLISTRRVPPESPFDSRENLSVRRVIEGLGGSPAMLVSDGKESGLYEVGGDGKMQAAIFSPRICHFQEQTVLASHNKVILIDPAKNESEIWLAGPSAPEAEQQRARWPGEANFAAWHWRSRTQVAFRGGELFDLERDGRGASRLHWWFDGAPPGGVEIPLQFELPASVRSELEPLKENFKGVVDWRALLDPSRTMIDMTLSATESGLILTNHFHGFWFVPFADLELWRETSAPPHEATPP